MGGSKKVICKLCMKTPKRNAIKKVHSLPKTFTVILEQMSGCKFSKVELSDMVICMECNHFLRNMDNDTSGGPKTNKITAEGKKRVFKLMEKKRVPAAEAIEIVLAEQRAKELLVQSGLKAPSEQLNLTNLTELKQALSTPLPRLSGAQRKKAGILMDAGMEPAAARQLIRDAYVAKEAAQQLLNQQFDVESANLRYVPIEERRGYKFVGRNSGQGTSQNGPSKSNAPGQRKAPTQGGAAQTGPGRQRKPQPQGGAAQKGSGGQQKPNAQKAQNQKSSVQNAAPVKNAPQKGPNSKPKNSTVQKVTASPGILLQQTNKRQNNNNPAGGKVLNPASVAARRNERPSPYNNNRQRNQSQQQNNNFNQRQQQQNQSNSLEVGIVPINYPADMLDDMKLDALKEAITNEIIKIPQGGPLIRFLGTSSEDGWLKLICADELSYNWLSMLVSRWERAGVRMVDCNAMPQPQILSLYLQGDFRSPVEILNIIDKQNNSLNANNWRVMNRESDGNGQLITVCVNEQCFQALQNRDFMVFLGLGVVELKPKRSDTGSFNNNSSQNFLGNNNDNFSNNYGGNSMQRGNSGNNYQSNNNNNRLMNSGYGNGGGGSNNYNNQGMGQGYQRGGYQNQRAW